MGIDVKRVLLAGLSGGGGLGGVGARLYRARQGRAGAPAGAGALRAVGRERREPPEVLQPREPALGGGRRT
jgi:poly(3-hydroxybutyrate) depolymerase